MFYVPKERMCEETFVCVSQGHFSLEQMRDEDAKAVVTTCCAF